MSMSAKSNLGHRRRLTHTRKRQIATSMVKEPEEYPGVFNSLGWRKRKWQIMQRVHRVEIRAKYHSEVRKGLRGQKETA